MECISWDDCSQLNGKIKNVPNHEPDIHTYIYPLNKRKQEDEEEEQQQQQQHIHIPDD
jgi:hypothetical protein